MPQRGNETPRGGYSKRGIAAAYSNRYLERLTSLLIGVVATDR
jgi:hypothetical protein